MLEMKICSNIPGHMTKMASRPIYGENPLGSGFRLNDSSLNKASS